METAPQGGEQNLREVLKEARSRKEVPDSRLPLFFTSSVASPTAGLTVLKRASARTVKRNPESGETIMGQQAKAAAAGAYQGSRQQDLGALILYPDAGHGALFQYPKPFVRHAALFLAE